MAPLACARLVRSARRRRFNSADGMYRRSGRLAPAPAVVAAWFSGYNVPPERTIGTRAGRGRRLFSGYI
jgi:hypothetical protein